MGKRKARSVPQKRTATTTPSKASIGKKSPALPPPSVPPSSSPRHSWRRGNDDDNGKTNNATAAAAVEVTVGRYPLSGVKELRLRGADVGSSVDLKSEPAALLLSRSNHDDASTSTSISTTIDASITICGGTIVARWVVSEATTAVIRAGDALIITISSGIISLSGGGGGDGGDGGGGDGGGVGARGGGVDVGDGGIGGAHKTNGKRRHDNAMRQREQQQQKQQRQHQQRAFVLSFMNPGDVDAAHVAIQRGFDTTPSTAAAGADATSPSAAKNAFDAKIEARSAADYFQYYAMLPQQQNMLQDRVRTGTYFTAITENAADFRGKVVLDVGAGSGILSFFAAMAGAKRVYAVRGPRCYS